jgi:hypothetical protein
MKFSRNEYLMGRDKTFPDDFTEELSENTDDLLAAVNEFFKDFKGPGICNSGFRPRSINAMTPHASKTSKHLDCLAIDINDPDGKVWQYVLDNLERAVKLNLYFEDPRHTRTKTGGWVHAQLGGPKSKRRIFIPSTSPAPAPNFWSGKYDSKWDK